ncbi:hypothetical protein, partial [Bacteroides thetaiotaomicron]|uniref:hypothetical protein n=1 Tax=Bacteroides thetaiotaomicron TaxID=818 RepID=UPI00232B3721
TPSLLNLTDILLNITVDFFNISILLLFLFQDICHLLLKASQVLALSFPPNTNEINNKENEYLEISFRTFIAISLKFNKAIFIWIVQK